MQSTSQHPSDEVLCQFHTGMISAAQANDIEVHLAVCQECVRRLEMLPDDSQLIQMIRGLDLGISDATPIPGEIRLSPPTEDRGEVDTR
ncbi:MAG: hypothetical protein N2039_01765 [Gemmataceae bacterium]|nr:hypothetical protein [Gemmataceae bacterium]